MDKTALYKEGARLPEQLARLIFLEGMVAGRRVLEVGSRSDAVARFLIEQGAARVVCAVEDRQLCEQLRDANDNDQIDFRVIRPAGGSRPPGIAQAPVLPGDDGAFDLVIDFTLPEALASGVSERLTDIKRLLSLDGFAITALASEPQNPRGLALLLDEGVAQPKRLAYRPLVDALRGTFELAQVYFQSMMLGYLFGSFDIEGGDDGIAPQTALMGDDAEPAGAYLFTFGNAIPVIDDVCLVQLPFDTLLDAILARRPLALGARAAQGNDHAAEIMALQAELRALAETNAQLRASASRPPMPAEDVGVVVESIARRLDEAVARALASEQQVAMREIELVRVLAVRDELRLERDALAEQLVALDGQAGALSSRSRSLEDELLLTAMRVEELEDSARADDARRSALQLELIELQTAREHERLRHNAERELLEAAIAESTASVVDLQAALDELGVPLTPPTTVTSRGGSDDDTVAYEDARNDGTATVAARVRASLQERFAIVEDRALRAEALATTLAEQLAVAEREREDLRFAVDERAAAVEAAHAAQAALATEGAAALHAALQTALDDARAALDRRTDEATKLAQAVVGLVDENEQHRTARAAQTAKLHALHEALRQARALADEHEERLATLTARTESASSRDHAELTELRLALDEARTAVAASSAAAESAREERARWSAEQSERQEAQQKLEQRRAHDQRQLEDARRQLEEARAGVFEITAQRDVVQQALVARERELATVVDEVASARARIEQLQAEHTARAQQHADVEKAAEALSLEVRRLNGVVDDNGARLLAVTGERDALQEQLKRAEAGRSSAEDEALKLMALVEEAESRGVADRDQWRAEQDEAHRAAIAVVEEQLQAATARLAETEAALTRALDAARLAADDSAEQRRALGEERENHERTRDELATTTSMMLTIEAEAARARADAEAAVAAAIADSDAVRAAREAEVEQTIAQLRSDGDTAVQAASDAVRAELTTSFTAEKDALVDELNEARAAHEQLVGVRTVIEATLAEATAALVERTAEFEALSARHAELGLEHGRRADEAKALAATIEALRAEHDAARAELSSSLTRSQSSLSLSAEATEALQAQLASTKAALASAEAELARQREATAAAEAEWLKAAEEASTATTALATLQAAHDAIVGERYALLIERETLTAKAAELATRVDVLQKRFDETIAQLEEVDEEAQLAAERAWQKGLEQDKAIADLRAALDDAGTAHAKVIDQIRAEHGDALAAAELAHAELEKTLETRSARETELELQATRARGDVDAAIADITRLREELAAAQTAHASTQATLQTALEEAAAIAATMTNRLREADEAHAAAVSALEAKLATELQRAVAAVDEHDAALAVVVAERDAALTAAAAQRAQLVAEHDAAIALVRGELADTVAGATQLTRDLEAARAEAHASLTTQQTRHEDHLASLEEERRADAARHADDLRAALARVDELTAANAAQATATTTATTRITELERALDDAIEQYAAEAELKEAHEAELQGARARLDEQTRATQQQQADIATRDEQLAALRREHEAVVAARDAAVAEREALQQRAEDDLHAAEQRFADMQERFDAAAREHADVDAARLAVVAALSAVETEQQALRARVADVDAQREALAVSEHRAAELASALDAARSEAAAAVATAQARAQEHETAAATLRAQLDALRADVDDERRELQEQVAKLSADADEERLRAEALEARVADLSARAADADLLREEAERQGTRHAAALDEAVASAVNNAVVTAAAAHAEAIDVAVAEAVAREQQRALAIADDVAAQLAALQRQLEAERAQRAVVVDTLDEARIAADRERARVAVLSATLDEARTAADRERARIEVLSATLDEARTAADRERARVAVLEATLDEARASADAERAQHQQHHQALLVGLEETRAAVKIAERRARDEARAAQMEVASLRAELDEVQASSSQLPTPVVDDELVARLRTEIAELNAWNESRTTEIAGLRDALLTAREDHRDLEELVNAHEARAEALSMTLAQQEQTLTALQQAHHDLNIDSEVANAQRDAAIAEIDAAEAQATEAMAARRVLEDELAALRLELERALAHATTTVAHTNTAEVSMLREKLEAADKHLRLRDEKIAEQAERINRLTERIVRTEQ